MRVRARSAWSLVPPRRSLVYVLRHCIGALEAAALALCVRAATSAAVAAVQYSVRAERVLLPVVPLACALMWASCMYVTAGLDQRNADEHHLRPTGERLQRHFLRATELSEWPRKFKRTLLGEEVIE